MTTTRGRRIVTTNGGEIHATFFAPPGDVDAAILIAPAMGVKQTFYAPLAMWLADQGCLVATFDYSGIGRSCKGHVREVRVDILDWARFDCAAVLSEAQRMAPNKPLLWIGHSLGGQIVGFVPGSDRITKVLTVATGSGYWRDTSPRLRRRVWWLWYVVVPVTMPLCGYFPGRRLRKVGDLPRGVMEQWRRWCLDPDYAVGVEGSAGRAAYASVRSPITSLSFVDDEMMSARSIQALHDQYVNAPKTMIRVAPSDVGVPRIGHFGFFSARHEASLWPRYLLPELKPLFAKSGRPERTDP